MKYFFFLVLFATATSCTQNEPTEIPCNGQVEFTELIVHEPDPNE